MEAPDSIVRCPTCGEAETRVIDSRDQDEGTTIRRRRECIACESRFTTFERIEAARLTVVKRDGSRVEFDHDRLASGLAKALTRRPVPPDAAEAAADAIEATLRASGASEVPSSRIGELAMDRLRALDQIAYIRFASVYQSYRGHRAAQARGRYPARGALDARRGSVCRRRAPQTRLTRDRWPSSPIATSAAAIEAGRIRIDPYDEQCLQPSSVDLHLDREFRVFRNNRYPYIDVRAQQPDLTELVAVEDEEAVHPPSRRVRARPDARMGRIARRSRVALGGEEFLGAARAAHPLHGGLRRPRLEGQPDARAVERRQPAHRALLRHEDRPDQLLPDDSAQSSDPTARRSWVRSTRASRRQRRRPFYRDFEQDRRAVKGGPDDAGRS